MVESYLSRAEASAYLTKKGLPTAKTTLDKLATVVLPRIRDFQGLSPNSFDGRGNYALGLKEQLVFPEIPYDTFDRIRLFRLPLSFL